MEIINFSGLADSTVVRHQYDSVGVDFVPPPEGPSTYYPVVRTYPAYNVMNISECVGCEFFRPAAKGIFLGGGRSTVSVSVGMLPESAVPSTQMILVGYDSSGTLVASSLAQSISRPNAGMPLDFSTTLVMNSAEGNITFFVVEGLAHDSAIVGISEVTFDDAKLSGSFTLTVDPVSVILDRGGSVDTTISVNRFGTAIDPVLLTIAALPPGSGVTATLSSSDALDSVVLTLSAADDALLSSGTPLAVTVTGYPYTTADGPGPQSVTIAAAVVDPFTITVDKTTVTPAQCTPDYSITVTVTRKGAFNGVVTLAVTGLPVGVTASFDPSATLDFSTTVDPDMSATLMLTVGPNPSAAVLTITASSPPFPASTTQVAFQPGQGSISGFDPTSGWIPTGAQGGTRVRISGTGFCPDAQIRFSNDSSAPTTTPNSVDPSGTSIVVVVPPLATTSNPQIVEDGGAVTITSPITFPVFSYRNTYGYSFVNNFTESYLDWNGWWTYVDEFGVDQMFLSADICSIATLGFYSCPVPTGIPDPLAFIYYTVTAGMLQSQPGLCFGMAYTSLRFLYGNDALSFYPPYTAQTAWQLTSPSGPSGPLYSYIYRQHLAQIGLEYGEYFLPFHEGKVRQTPSSLYVAIQSWIDFRGPFVLLGLWSSDSRGHVVVVTGLEPPAADGSYIIDVYNPNAPYTTSEESNYNTHVTAQVVQSQVQVLADGSWTFNGLSPAMKGGMSGLVAAPYWILPVSHPTIPSISHPVTDLSALISSIVVSGDTSMIQMQDSTGHYFLNPDGTLNNDFATMLNARPMAVAGGVGGIANDLPPIYWIALKSAEPVTQSYVGRSEGSYSVHMFSVNGAATLANIESIRDLRDDVVLDPLVGRIDFRTQAMSKRFQGKVIARAVDGNGHEAEVSTKSFKGGRDQVWFSSTGDTLLYYHSGEQTTAVIQLSAAGPTVLPSTLELPPIQVDDGDIVAVAPESWSQLEARGVRIRIHGGQGAVREMDVAGQPFVRSHTQMTRTGEVDMTIYASEPYFNRADLGSIQASSTPDGPWQTLTVLSGRTPISRETRFDITDSAFGGSENSGQRTFYVRLLDQIGTVLEFAMEHVEFSPRQAEQGGPEGGASA